MGISPFGCFKRVYNESVMQSLTLHSFAKDVSQLGLVVLFLGAMVLGSSIVGSNNARSAERNLIWLTSVGSGLVAPACWSAAPTLSCAADGTATVRLDWGYALHSTAESCSASSLFLNGSLITRVEGSCYSSYIFTQLPSNTSYNYEVVFHLLYWVEVGEGGGWWAESNVPAPGSFTTPNCQPPEPNLQGRASSVTGALIAGGNVTFTGNIVNPSSIGAYAAADGTFVNRFEYKLTTTSWTVAVFVDTPSASYSIPVDGSAPTSVSYTLPPGIPAGDYDLRLCADTPTDAIDEYLEGDNCGPSIPFTVVVTPLPPGAPPGVGTPVLDISVSPGLVRPGNRVDVSWRASGLTPGLSCQVTGTNGDGEGAGSASWRKTANAMGELGSHSKESTSIFTTTKYTLTCGGSSDSAIVRVTYLIIET